MRPDLVHHPAYTVPLPAEHRFPMGKFAGLIEHLRAVGLAEPARLVRPDAGAARLAGMRACPGLRRGRARTEAVASGTSAVSACR